MNNVERVGRHIVRTFYDPPPVNNDDAPIWCLGTRYDSKPTLNGHTPSPPASKSPETPRQKSPKPTPIPDDDPTPTVEEDSWIHAKCDEPAKPLAIPKPIVDPASASVYGGWPQDFLDDFESRIWMTYRSGFPPMPRSQDPKATAAMSFRVRLQNLNQSGFTSDTGFGCMIRSGQCILANALASVKLGRGRKSERA
jgi:cysteine protease ATG4